MKKTIKQNYSVTNTYDIEFKPLSEFTDTKQFTPDLFVVKVTNDEKKEGFYNTKNQQIWNGIINQEKLDMILANPEKTKNEDSTIRIENPVWAVKPGFIKHFVENGFNHIFSDLNKEDKKIEMSSFNIKNVIDNTEPVEFIQLVPNEQHLRIWKDNKGTCYTEPMIFNYVSAQLDNKKYDLDALVEHFMQRDDIAFISDSEGYSFSGNKKLLKYPLKGTEPEIKHIISDIPSYNAEDGRTETICIVYYPKSEDLEKILAFKDRQDKRYYNLDTYIIGEILGANPYLNQPPEPEIDTTPKRKFKK